jgi:eukaryotic-like serine/threonine-protein kinase
MIGQTFSHYRILKKLGSGGMGELYLAEDDRLSRKVALKILPEQFTQDAGRVRRFEQEARAASALNHPNIITIYEIGQIDREALEETGKESENRSGTLHFIAIEFIEGETLRQRMNSRRLSLSEAIDITVQAASALQAAHMAGIVHRDIKPENLMIRPDGFIKVLDFGLAKLTEQVGEIDLEAPTRSLFETQPGMMIGTLAYMSPEQARGFPVDARTDIFSLGIVLYEMITGQRPFRGATPGDMIAALLVGEPARLSEQLPSGQKELEGIVSRMLSRERDSRYQTAQELLSDLRREKIRLDFASESAGALKLEDRPALNGPAISAPVSFETDILPVHTKAPLQKRWLLPALIALGVVLAAGLIGLQLFRRSLVIDSIAVLPFVNETSDPEAEYLSEGIAEGIINRLSQLPELSVASRNSAIRYKGKETDAQVVGRELGVKAVLLGRIKRRGDSLAINAELVNAHNGYQIWGERLNRKISDLMAVQDEILFNIGEKLGLPLRIAQKDVLAKYGTRDAEAYDLYLKGRFFWNQGTLEAMKKADEYFEAAATRDPSFALAAAGCAACHAAGSDGRAPQESMSVAKLVALKVLKADDTIIDAHLALAQVNLRYDWRFADAEREFKRAIELNPKHATAHQRYAEFLALLGRHKEAAEEIWKAHSLDPHSLPINSDIGRLSYYAKNYDHAIDHLRKTLEINQQFAPAHEALGQAYEQKGQTQDAILAFLRAKRLTAGDQDNLMALKKAYAGSGREAFWREYQAQLAAESNDRYVPSSIIAALHTRLGEHDKAFDALERAYRERDGGLIELKVEPIFEPLRPNTRFGELIRRIGLD